MGHFPEKAPDVVSKAREGRVWGLPPRETQSCLLRVRRGLLGGALTAFGQRIGPVRPRSSFLGSARSFLGGILGRGKEPIT